MDNNQSNGSEIAKSVLNAVNWVAQTCNEVNNSTIKHCFTSAGFNTDGQENLTPPVDPAAPAAELQ